MLHSCQAQVQAVYKNVHTSDLVMGANILLVPQLIFYLNNPCSKEEHIVPKHAVLKG